MSDTLNILGLADDYGSEQGLIQNGQLTDDPTPHIRVSLTTSSGGTLAAGDTIKVSDLGAIVGQATITADDVSRGYIDAPAGYQPTPFQHFGASAYDASGAQVAGSAADLGIIDGAGQSLLRTDLTDGGYTLSYTSSSGSPFYHAFIQHYEASGHAVGLTFDGNYESGSPNNYSITPLAGGNSVALFLDGDHFTNRKGPVFDAQGHVLNNVVTGFNGVATAGTNGGFVLSYTDVGFTGDAFVQAYDNSGAAMSDSLELGWPMTGVHALSDGRIDVGYNDNGTPRDLIMDPLHLTGITNPGAETLTAWDDAGPQTGQISSGGTTDDTTPTIRLSVRETGEVVIDFGKANTTDGAVRTVLHVTDADIARGYVQVDESTFGDATYSVRAKFIDSDGLVSPRMATGFTLQTSPPPPSGGQTLRGQPGGSNLVGGSGDDTLVGGSGPDTMTGAGGGDHFVWNSLPWSPGHVADFTDGSDKLDLSGLLTAYHYGGSDPVADGWVKPIDDGQGNTWIYFDTDGRGTADQWGTFVTTLDHVPASSITSADLAGGTTTSPPPTSPPPTSPPPTSPPPPGMGGETLRGQSGGSNLVGGPGEDTLIGGSGPDTMTGAGGADHFMWTSLPWSPGHVTDFTDGTDRLDVSSLLSAYHYAGSDPVADGWVKAIDDGHGNAWIYFDTDGRGSGDQWGTFVTTLDHLSASQITSADLIRGADTPPPPPPQSPPPASGGQVLRAQDGGSHLTGASGDDTLIGAHGPDVMTGAGGADHFEFDVLPWSAAQITDFVHGADKIDLSHLLSGVGYAGADPLADGYVKPVDDGHGNTWLYFDTDGHGSADAWGTFVATLQGVSAANLTVSDFIFH